MKKAKVVVAMSGGVDSSVAAALLKDQGYDVYGITMKLSNWQETEGRKFGGCCGSKDFYDARSVAQTLGIPHYSLDYVDQFKVKVIDYFKASYTNAETPNPCIACNNHIKFDRLLNQAMAMGADYLATGHYARIETIKGVQGHNGVQRQDGVQGHNVVQDPERRYESERSSVPERRSFVLKKAIDASKDQSYVLYHLGQAELSKLMFPLGGYTKTEIRELARKYGLKTADKPDSYEICFVPNLDYKQFVTEEIPEAQRPEGAIRHVNGSVLGKHRGLPFYTVGQREGLGISVGRPLYVVALDKQSNTLVVGEKEDVLSRTAAIRDVVWSLGQPPELPCDVTIKIRSRHLEAVAEIQPDLSIRFEDPQSAVTPGQAAVFYKGDAVLGGGVIDRVR